MKISKIFASFGNKQSNLILMQKFAVNFKGVNLLFKIEELANH